MKVAVIGAGGWGKNIVRTLYQLNALDSVTELNKDLQDKLKQDYPGITIYESIEDMLANSQVPVVLATPVATHFKLGKQLLEAKRHLFIEKPMAMNEQQCQELNDLSNQNDLVLMVGHLLIYQSAIAFIKQFIDQGKLGKLYQFAQVRRNLGTVRAHENALYSLGVHDIAVLDYLINETPIKVVATGQAILNADIEDDVSVELTYPNGVKAQLHTSWLWPYKERHMIISGEKGFLKFDELTQQVVFYGYEYNNHQLTTSEPKVVFADAAQPLAEEMQHFMQCCQTSSKPNSDGLQGQRVVAIMEQALEQLKS